MLDIEPITQSNYINSDLWRNDSVLYFKLQSFCPTQLLAAQSYLSYESKNNIYYYVFIDYYFFPNFGCVALR